MINVQIGRADAAVPAVKLDEAKAHLDVCHGDDDHRILSLVASATEYVENIIHGSILLTNHRLMMSGWAECVELPRWPLRSLTSVQYLPEGDGPKTDWDGYDLLTLDRVPSRLTRKANESWPALSDATNPVEIEYVAGYAAAADVPETIKHAIRLLTRHWYDMPGPEVVGTITSPVGRSLNSLLRMHKPGQVAGVNHYG